MMYFLAAQGISVLQTQLIPRRFEQVKDFVEVDVRFLLVHSPRPHAEEKLMLGWFTRHCRLTRLPTRIG
jgi:hypothetical protein